MSFYLIQFEVTLACQRFKECDCITYVGCVLPGQLEAVSMEAGGNQGHPGDRVSGQARLELDVIIVIFVVLSFQY